MPRRRLDRTQRPAVLDPPGEEDRRRQQGILCEVLERFPITELRRDGLLRLNGEVIEPTLAAIRANELLDVTV